MTEPTELLPCPFCGSKATASVNKGESLWSHDVVDWTRVHCANDDCNVQTEATCEGYEPSAIEVWNRRTPQAVSGKPVAWWIPKAEQFCLADKSGDRPFAKAWEPLYATPQPTQAAPTAAEGPSDSEIDALVVSIGPTEGIRRDSRDLTMDKLRVLVRRALATWGHVNAAPAAQGDAEDAARYRWLRDFHADEIHDEFPHVAAGENYEGAWALSGDELDAAIDAARKQGANHD